MPQSFRSLRVSLLAACVAAALAAPARAEVRGQVHVHFPGGAPPPATVPVTKDRLACGETARDESLLVGPGGGLANAVVTVRAGATPAPGRATLDQRGCGFVPHVQAVPVGSALELANSDAVLHGVRGEAGRATAFDVPLPGGARTARTLSRPGPIRVSCHVHGWMSAWVVVVDGPTAVTDAEGRFAIAGVPPGEHVAVVWHERLGEQVVPLTVSPSGEGRLEVTYRGAAGAAAGATPGRTEP